MENNKDNLEKTDEILNDDRVKECEDDIKLTRLAEIEKLKEINATRKKLNKWQLIVSGLIFIFAFINIYALLIYNLYGKIISHMAFYLVNIVFSVLGIIELVLIIRRFRNSNLIRNIFMSIDFIIIYYLLYMKKSVITFILLIPLLICFFYQWRMEKIPNEEENI